MAAPSASRLQAGPGTRASAEATGIPWQRRSNSRAAGTERADIPVRRSSSGAISSGGPGFMLAVSPRSACSCACARVRPSGWP